ncbi:hypothetical protein QAD02_022478 [Eretmocerus hayati]|uniref:Uncharacterized protein n=1 Tax=Eretmocerus hayati TaxID=131215 RepID=A0ACC2PTP7_9HYME|nr:hypothetical protein QAD02_022478 [Eretmocerus hayati]
MDIFDKELFTVKLVFVESQRFFGLEKKQTWDQSWGQDAKISKFCKFSLNKIKPRSRRSGESGYHREHQIGGRYRGIGATASDGELAQAEGRRHQDGSPNGEKPCLLHEGLHVDQLARYRRRRVEQRPPDHLGLPKRRGRARVRQDKGDITDPDEKRQQEEDEDEDEEERDRLITEYRLAYRASSDDLFLLAAGDSSARLKRGTEDGKALPVVERAIRPNENSTTASDPQSSRNAPPDVDNSKETRGKWKSADDLSPYKTQNEIDFSKIMSMGVDELRRPAPYRRPTTLRVEGELSCARERDLFVPFIQGMYRPELRRRGTSLRVPEAVFGGHTEKSEQFVAWPLDCLLDCRPEPIRLPTNLKLEGELHITTECREKYVPFIGAKRPELLKRRGELAAIGEPGLRRGLFNGSDDSLLRHRYRQREQEHLDHECFRSASTDRSSTLRIQPEFKLTVGEPTPEKDDMVDFLCNPQGDEENDDDMLDLHDALGETLEDLKGPPLEIPEYRAAFKDFPRERPKLMKPEDEIGRADGSKVPSPSPARFKTKIDQDPEYKSIHLEPSYRDRLPFPRPLPANSFFRSTSGRNSLMSNPISSNGDVTQRKDSRPLQMPTSEIRAQYVDYGKTPRAESLRIPTTLRLEGSIDMEPEYRNAYCSANREQQNQQQNTTTTLTVPGVTSVPNRRERSSSTSMRRRSGSGSGNYWLENNNAEHFGTVNASGDQDAFQVLHTRVHEDSVVGKPPPGTRRNSSKSFLHPRGSLQPEPMTVATSGATAGGVNLDRSPSSLLQPQQQVQEPNLMVRRGSISTSTELQRQRSPSPSITGCVSAQHLQSQSLQARRRRSPVQLGSIVHPSHDRSPSPRLQQSLERPYSPSFARDTSASEVRQAFVVLDNRENEEDVGPRRRKTDNNFNPRDSLASIRGSNGITFKPKNKTPPNWMPPWYDSSTSTI